MKKIVLGLVGLMGLMEFVGCDKIEESEYTVFDGAVVTWQISEKSIMPVQRAYVEKYTGPRCSNCPNADVTLAGIHNDNVVMVSINHPTGQGMPYPDQPDLRTDGGNAWDAWFGINAIPAAYLNRNRSTQYQGSMSNIVNDINEALTINPTVAMEAEAHNVSGKVNITVNLQFMKEYRDKVTLTVALVEDSLCYKQLLPDGSYDENYVHNHMLRKVITGFWGRDVEAIGAEGEALTGSLSFTPDDDIVLANSHIVAFISDKGTRKVLNCVNCAIE